MYGLKPHDRSLFVNTFELIKSQRLSISRKYNRTCCHMWPSRPKSIRLRHWGRGKMAAIFADDIFTCIFLNENICSSIKIMSVKFVPKRPIDNIPVLGQIMAWRRPGDKPLSEPILVYWRIYASLGLNDLLGWCHNICISMYIVALCFLASDRIRPINSAASISHTLE